MVKSDRDKPKDRASPPDDPPSDLDPFFIAFGFAMARWQHVEIGLFMLIHAIMGADFRFSSIVFFHIQSPSAKLELADRLCREHFDKVVIKDEWQPLGKAIRAGLELRNGMAHWEVNFVNDPTYFEHWEPNAVLAPSFLHPTSRTGNDTKGATARTLREGATEYLRLAMSLLDFVPRHFQEEALAATHLPLHLRLYLANSRKAAQDTPPPPGS
jgi:hypothetical protein